MKEKEESTDTQSTTKSNDTIISIKSGDQINQNTPQKQPQKETEKEESNEKKKVSNEGVESTEQKKEDQILHSRFTGTPQSGHQNTFKKCYLCSKADGRVLTLCKCKPSKDVHFECIQAVIISNQSLICRSCQKPYLGVYPVYAKKKVSRFVSKYVRIMAYRLIGIPLFVMLLIRVILLKSKTIHSYEKHFWIVFFAYFVIALIILGVYTYRGIQTIKEYNLRNSDILELELDEQWLKNSGQSIDPITTSSA